MSEPNRESMHGAILQSEVVPSFEETLIETTGALLFVLIAIVVVAFLYKRLRHPNDSSSEQLRIRDVLTIGHREQLMVVKVGEEHILLSHTPNGIDHLHTLQTEYQPNIPDETPKPDRRFYLAMSKLTQ